MPLHGVAHGIDRGAGLRERCSTFADGIKCVGQLLLELTPAPHDETMPKPVLVLPAASEQDWGYVWK